MGTERFLFQKQQQALIYNAAWSERPKAASIDCVLTDTDILCGNPEIWRLHIVLNENRSSVADRYDEH